MCGHKVPIPHSVLALIPAREEEGASLQLGEVGSQAPCLTFLDRGEHETPVVLFCFVFPVFSWRRMFVAKCFLFY